MKSLVVFFVLCLGACSQKRNPDRCCVSEADCAAIGLPNGSTCLPGELCRGNECVEQTCSMSSQCDLAAPYCEDSHCAEMCVSDESCPGAEQMNRPFCISGGCVQCRDSGDCGDRVCVNGSCTGCATDGECASGVCVVTTGLCASTSAVAYVSPSGSPTSDCAKSEPCTLLRALAVNPPRETIKLAKGNYQNASTVTVEGKRTLSGESPDQTRITNGGNGPVFVVGSNGEISFERMEVFGAKTGLQPGVGVQCTGTAKLRMSEVRLAMNASHGVDASCDVIITRSRLVNNFGFGANVSGNALTPYTVERSTITGNAGGGIKATGRGTVRNNFIFKNTGTALELALEGYTTSATRPDVSFNTVVQSDTAMSCVPTYDSGQITVANNILEGYHENPVIGVNKKMCAVTGCVVRQANNEQSCTSSFSLVFVSEQNDDYHLMETGLNPAIDGAGGGAGLLDYDGEQRPKGAAADIGADEAF